MNLLATLALYGEGPRFTLPESGTWHKERSYPLDREQQRKGGPDVGGVVKADAAGSDPDIYDVTDSTGRLLHKGLSYEQAKRASEARRYAKVVRHRGIDQQVGKSSLVQKYQEDAGKRKVSNIEKKILDRRSLQTPDLDWKQGA